MQTYALATSVIIVHILLDNHCAIVEDTGPDIYGKESGIIAPHGLCTLWDPNEEETR
jgi:hypothetical protein